MNTQKENTISAEQQVISDSTKETTALNAQNESSDGANLNKSGKSGKSLTSNNLSTNDDCSYEEYIN